MVDRESGRDRGQPGPLRFEGLPRLQSTAEPQERLLHDVLGVAEGAEHAVGDIELRTPMLGVRRLEALLDVHHLILTRQPGPL